VVMTRAAASQLEIRRLFDDGRAILWRGDARADGTAEGFEIIPILCTNPGCNCNDIQLEIHPVTWNASGERLAQEHPMVAVTLELPSGEVVPKDAVEEGSAGAAVLANLGVGLHQDGLLEFLRARWHRAKHFDDPDEWRGVDWSKVDLDSLVPFFEAFPSRWDLCVVVDGEFYWAMDSWCLKAGCSCTDVVVNFLAERTEPVGTVQVDSRTGRAGGPNCDRRGLELWGVLDADPQIRKELRWRRAAMRRAARGIPAFLEKTTTAVRTVKAGRNEPCPCGSGKKHKRCCG